MSGWIIVRDGPYRYFKEAKGIENYSTEQKDARRFSTRAEAKRCARRTVACYSSSYPVRVVKLIPPRPSPFVELAKVIKLQSSKIKEISDLVDILCSSLLEHLNTHDDEKAD